MSATQTGYALESATYLEKTETYQFEYDTDTTPPSMAVVTALSAVKDTDPTALEPLQAHIDIDALDTLAGMGDPPNSPAQIKFSTDNCTVTIDSDGMVEVVPPEDHRDQAVSHK